MKKKKKKINKMICLLNMALTTTRYDVIIDPIFREIRPIESKFIVIYFTSLWFVDLEKF